MACLSVYWEVNGTGVRRRHDDAWDIVSSVWSAFGLPRLCTSSGVAAAGPGAGGSSDGTAASAGASVVAGTDGVAALQLLVLVEVLAVLVLVPVTATGIDGHVCMLVYALVFWTMVTIGMLLHKHF